MPRGFVPGVSDGIPLPGGAGGGWQAGVYGDGLPPQTLTPTPPPPGGGAGQSGNGGVGGYESPYQPESGRNRASSINERVGRVMQFEGPRGKATRAAVWLRYVAFLLEIVILSAVTHALTEGIPRAGGAGKWMLFACAIVLTCGALATMRHPNERNKIVKEARHYILGIMVRPGTAIAVFIWGSKGFFDNVEDDAFAGVLTNALPIVYFCTVFIPALVFIKMVFGLGQMNRSMEDNQKMVERYTRQDGYQK